MSTIRQAVPQDLQAINRLLGEVLRVHHELRPDLFRPEGKKYTDVELLALFANPLTPAFVFEDSAQVEGYIFCELQHFDSGSMVPRTTLYIDDLCVSPSARRKGVARALYSKAEDFARKNGCHNITLHVWEGNSAALSLYKSLGMTPQYTSMEVVL